VRPLQARHRLRDGGEGNVDRQHQERQAVLGAGLVEALRKLRALLQEAEHQAARAARLDPGDELGDPHSMRKLEPVGQDQLALLRVGAGVGQLGHVDAADVAVERLGGAAHPQAQRCWCPPRANTQPAFGAYFPTHETEIARLYGIVVLTLDGPRISAMTWFGGNSAFPHFGLPRLLR
jgi:hypothetical protein